MPRDKKSRHLRVETLERRELLAVDLIGIRPDAGALLFEGDTLKVPPREFNLLFNGGADLDEATIRPDTVKLVRSGGDDLFGDANDVEVTLGYVGLSQPGSIDPLNLQRIQLRPASSAAFNVNDPATAFPDDLYQIHIVGSGATPLTSLSGEVFNGGVDLVTTFRLDRGAQVVAIVPQPLSRNTQRLSLGGASGGTYILSFQGEPTAPIPFNASNNDIQLALEALPNVQPGDVTVTGGVSPEINFQGQFAGEQVPLMTVNDGALSGGFASVSRLQKLSQATDQIVVYFDNQRLNEAQVVDPKFYRLIDTASTLSPDDDRTILPKRVTYDVGQNSVVLYFASAIPEGNYRLDIGHSGGDDDLTTNALPVGSLFDENPFTHTGYLGDKGGSSEELTDRDLYKVTLRDGATLSVTTTPGAAGLVLATTLLDDSGVPVPGADLTAGYTVSTTQPFVDYFIEVAGDVGNTGFGAYTMVASVNGSPLFNSDGNSTVDDATQVGTLGVAGITISSQIQPQAIRLPPLPGSEDEPGHRQIQREQHIGALGTTPALPSPTIVRYYHFPNTIGTDTSGNPYSNLITETEKQIVREIFEIYAQLSGFEFIESTGTAGTKIGKGDLRALDPTLGPNSGVAGLGSSSAVVLNGALFDDSNRNFGDGFTGTMFHEIGHSLGLGHAYDLPATMGGSLPNDVQPGDNDVVHLQRIAPPDSTDIDMYRFELVESGQFTAETIAERLPTPSLLNSALTLYRQTASGDIELVARNDQYFGSDSLIDLHLQPGTYFVGVTSTGNTQYDPRVPDSGYGGSTNGAYDLKLGFEPDREGALLDSRGTAIDGDADGSPGGVHSFWFQGSDPSTGIYVDKVNDTTANTVDGSGSLNDPYDTIDFALTQAGNRIVVPADATAAALAGQSFVVDDGINPAVTFSFNGGANPITLLGGDDAIAIAGKIRSAIDNHPGLPAVTVAGTGRVVQLSGIDNLDISGSLVLINTPNLVHIVGNGGADRNIDTLIDNRPYLIGQDVGGANLADGPEFLVPQGVNVMLHAGALLKMRVANLDAGTSTADIDRSRSAIQVLGTPNNAVFLRSFHNDLVGGDSDGVGPDPSSGNFGGIVFRQDSDLEDLGIFLNYVNHVDISNGGGKVFVGAREEVFTPIHVIDARPTLSFNRIATSDDAAISASPDSFDDSLGRIGPDVHGNFLEDNTIDGLFIRIETPLGSNIDKLTVSGRFNDTDITHVLSENLIIAGAAGGPIQVGGILQARPAGRLVIDPGTVIKLKLSRIEAERGAGSIIAEGTVDRPIIFTSLADDRYGGSGSFDSDDTAIGVPQPEDWGGLFFGEATSGSIDHAVITYGGGTTQIEGGAGSFSAIEIHQADVRITNSLIQANGAAISGGVRHGRGRNQPAAIYVRGAQPIIVNNDITDNLGSAISINANSLRFENLRDLGRSTGTVQDFAQFADNSGPLIRLNRLDDNGTYNEVNQTYSGVNGLEVRGELLTTQSVWDDTDIVHVLLDEIVVDNFHTFGGLRLQSSNSESLVVKLDDANGSAAPLAGFTATGTPVETYDRIGGTIQVLGTVGHPVIVTHLFDDSVGAGFSPNGLVTTNTNNSPAPTTGIPGRWRGFLFDEFSNDRNVAVVRELESPLINGLDVNRTPALSQRVGTLAPDQKSGDENRRLGFEITGYISPTDPDDVDVYSFTATAGTPIWIDIDRTDTSLDAIVEVVNSFGTVLARSMRSGDTLYPGTLLAPNSQLTQDPTLGGDHYTQNFRDPGLYYVLPGTPGEEGRYFIRVRSNPASAASVTALEGESRGKYQLQIRLDQIQEFPGSTVQYADIRFAETGIELQGVPAHSPMIGEAGELIDLGVSSKSVSNDFNNSYASADTLINLLQSDMAAIGISGELWENAGNDVDWYAFDVVQTGVQVISGVNDEAGTIAVVLDLDYSDNAVRSDTTIAVYDDNQNLIYVGRESNVQDDQPIDLTGNIDDLSRGSIGKKDGFIGPIHLIPNSRYYVAVMSDYQVPAALAGAFQAAPDNANNRLVRLEPVNSLVRVVEDHIGVQGYHSRGVPILPSTPAGLFDISTGTIASGTGVDAHITPFTFQDVALYVGTDLVEIDTPLGTTTDDHLYTVDPFIENRWLTRVDEGQTASFVPGVNDVQDFAIRTDGRLFGYQRLNGVDNAVGALVEFDPSDLSIISVQNDNIPGTGTSPNTRSFSQVIQNEVSRSERADQFLGLDEVDGLAIQRTGNNAAFVPRYDVYYSVRESDFSSRLYRGRESGDASLGLVNLNPFYGYVGSIQPLGVTYTTKFMTLVQPQQNAPPDITRIRIKSNRPGAAGDFNLVVEPVRPDNTQVVVAVSGGTISLTIGLDVNNQGQIVAAPTASQIVDAINSHNVAGKMVTAVIFDGNDNAINDGSPATQAWNNPNPITTVAGSGNPAGKVTGMSFGNWDGTGNLYAVTEDGQFLVINPNTARVIQQIDAANRIGVTNLNFQGLTLGPQNVENGRYKNTLFAVTDTGLLVAFDTSGFGFTAFGAPDPNANFVQVVSTGPGNTGGFFTLTTDADALGNFGRQTTLPIRIDAPSTISINEAQFVNAVAHDGTFTISVLDDLGAVSSPKSLISATQPTVELQDTTGFPSPSLADPFVIKIENELMLVTDVNAGVYTVTRAYGGTTAAIHPDSATVFEVVSTTSSFDLSAPANTTISTAIDDQPTSTTLTVANVSPFPSVPFTIRVENEEMRVTAINGNDLTVARAQNGTTIAHHRIGRRVYLITDSLTVVDTTPFPANPTPANPFNLRIGNEDLRVIGLTNNTYDVIRGANSTVMSAHTAGTIVHRVDTTVPLPYNATGNQITTALENLQSVGAGNVVVLNGPLTGGAVSSPVTIEFVGALAARNLSLMTGDPAELVGDEIQEITLDATVVTNGVFQLDFNGDTTGDIPWNATPAQVEAALKALTTIGPGDILVTGSNLPAGPISIQFTGDLQDQDVADLTVALNDLRQNEQQEIMFTGAAVTAGSFTLDLNDPTNGINNGVSQPIPFDATPAAVQSALEAGIPQLAGGNITVTGTNLPGGTMVIEFTGAFAGVDMQQFTFTRIGFTPAQSSISVNTIRTVNAPPPTIVEVRKGTPVSVPVSVSTDGILSVRDALLNLPNFAPGDLIAAGELQNGGVAINFDNNYATTLVNPLEPDNFLNLPDDSGSPQDDDAIITLEAAPGPGTPGSFIMQVSGMNAGGADVIGLAFSPLDFNLWHPTTKRGDDAGRGVNASPDNTRTPGAENYTISTTTSASADRDSDESRGGASFHFGFEQWQQFTNSGSLSYLTYGSTNAQYGILTERFHSDLASNPNLVNTYNFPAGALGSLTTNSFSLSGSAVADRPVLYFNYFLETEAHPGSNVGSDRTDPFTDSARVFISRDGLPEGDPNKLWELVATNNSLLSNPNPSNTNGTAELGGFLSHLSDPGLNAVTPRPQNQQIIQELMDNTGVWRQARVDLSTFAGEPNLELRIDFSTAGSMNDATLGRIDDEIQIGNPGDTAPFGEYQANASAPRSRRSVNNQFEGFYIDDIIVGYAERGEMVTGTVADSAVIDISYDPTSDASNDPKAARMRDPNPDANPDIVNGAYQLEIRRTEEYIRDDPNSTGDPIVQTIFDTNTRHIPEVAPGSSQMMADRNRERPQGIFIIDSNFITNSSLYGINVHPGDEQPQTPGTVPHQGPTINFPQLNADRFIPGAVIQNNVIAGSSGIRFAGETNPIPQRPVPFGRIVNNTLVGDGQSGIGIEVVGLAAPTLMNNLLTDLATGISDGGNSTVIRTNFFQNNIDNGDLGTAAIEAVVGAPLFIDAANRNYYLLPGSAAVDSSQNTEQDRFDFVTFKTELGIPESPINAPDRDVYGQLRIDSGSSPGGGGSTVFKDRGAVDRSDKDTPFAQLLNPIDNDVLGLDRDPNKTVVHLSDPLIEKFSILLGDGPGPNSPFEGTGVNGLTVDDPNDLTVADRAVKVEHDGQRLVQGVDYTLGFNPFTGVLQLTPLTTLWEQTGVYTITLNNNQIADLAGNLLRSNQSDGTTKFFILMPDVDLDYGDAPPSFGTFLSNNGARHAIIAGAAPRLGRRVDGEQRSAVVASTSSPAVFSISGNTITVIATAAGGERITVSVGQEVATFELVTTGGSPSAGNVAVPWAPGHTTDMIASNLTTRLNSFFGTLGGTVVFQVNGASPSTINTVQFTDDLPQLVALSGSPIFTLPPSSPSSAQVTLSALPVGNEQLTVRIGTSIATFQFVATGFAPAPGNIAVQLFDSDTIDTVVARLADAINFRLIKEGDAAVVAVDGTSTDTIDIETFDDEDGVGVGTFTDGGGTDRLVFLRPGSSPATSDPDDVLGFLNPYDVFGTTIAITATGNGLLDAWIDFDGDGAFAVDEQIFKNQLLLDFNDPSLAATDGANLLNIVTPPNTPDGLRWARFRISDRGNLGPDELGIGGEIEDHQVQIINIPPTIPLPDNYPMNEGPQPGDPTPHLLDTSQMTTPPAFDYPSIFDNDSPTGFLPPEFVVVDPPAVGTLTVADPFSGRFTYEPPDGDFSGVVTFTYWVPTQPEHGSILPPNVTLGTVTITVNEVNDPPLNANAANFPASVSVNESTPSQPTSSVDLSFMDFADVDAGTGLLTVTLSTSTGGQLAGITVPGVITVGGTPTALTIQGTLDDLNTYFDTVGNITYAHSTPHLNGLGADTINFMINDEGNSGGPGVDVDLGTVDVNIDAVNNLPENIGTFPSDISVLESTDASPFSNVDLSVLQFDDVDVNEGTGFLTVTLSTSTGGQLAGAAAANITVGGFPTALTIRGTLVDLNNYFDNPSNITYEHASRNVNGNDLDTINVSISDEGNFGQGGVLSADLGTTNVDITAVNTPPFDSAGVVFPINIRVLELRDGDVDMQAIQFADHDADEGTGQLTVTLTTANGGELTAAAANGFPASGPATTLTFTGTLFDLNAYFDAALPSNVTYKHSNPTLLGDDVDTIEIKIDDLGNSGLGAAGPIVLGTINVSIDAVNDPPFNTGGLPASIPAWEDQLSPVDLSLIEIDDVDANGGNLTVMLSTTSGGTLAATSGGNVTVLGDGTGALTLTGTLTDLNAFLDNPTNIHYLSVLNANRNNSLGDAIEIKVSDNGNTGVGGGVPFDFGSVDVDIAPTNDPPLFNVTSRPVVNEDGDVPPIDVNLAGIAAGPTADETELVRIKSVTSSNQSVISNSDFTFNRIPFTGQTKQFQYTLVDDAFTTAASGPVVVTVVLEDPGPDGFFDDNLATPSIDESADNASTPHSFTVTVTPVNDPPDMDPISTPPIDERSDPATLSDPVTVDLTGIVPGPPNESESVRIVSATSSNPSIVPDPQVLDFGDGTAQLLYRPATLFVFGTVTITVTLEDAGFDNDFGTPGDNVFEQKQFDITINPVNQPPSINDPPLVVTLNEPDVDFIGSIPLTGIGPGAPFENDTLAVSATSDDPELVTIDHIVYTSPNTSGTLFYKVPADAHGTTTIKVTVTDSGVDNNTTEKTIQIVVNPVNDPPLMDQIVPQVRTVDEADDDMTWHTVNLTGIAAGPTGGRKNESENVRISGVSSDSSIISEVQVDYTSPNDTAVLSYRLVKDAFGQGVTITVTVEDAGLDGFFDDRPQTSVDESADNLSIQRTFFVNVNSINDAPTLNVIPDRQVDEDSGSHTLNLTGITAGASNENQTLTVTARSDTPSLVSVQNITYVNPSSTGSLIFATQPDQNGSAVITVTVDDGQDTFSRSFTVTVNPINDPPTFRFPTLDPNPALRNVLVDEDSGETLVPIDQISAGPADESETVQVLVTTNNPGLFSDLSADYTSPSTTGLIRFTPKPDAFGVATVTVTVEEIGLPTNLSSSQVFTVTVKNLPDPPTANADNFDTDEDSALLIESATLLANDVDPDIPDAGEKLTVLMPATSLSAKGATITYNSNTGRIVYDPSTSSTLQMLDLNSQATDSFQYSIIDQFGGLSTLSTAQVNLTVAGRNDAPTAVDDRVIAKSTTLPLIIRPLENDFDIDSDFDVNGGGVTLSGLVITQEPRFGSIAKQINATSGVLELAYSPFGAFTGNDQFRYTIVDNHGQSSQQATVTIEPSVVPVTGPDTGTGFENDDVTIAVLANDNPAPGQGSLNPLSLAIAATPASGQAIPQADGTVIYRPDTGFFGTDTFRYTVNDAAGHVSDPTLVTVTINERIPPTTTADSGSGLENDSINIDVLSNDAAVQGQLDPSTLTIFSHPTSGQVTINGDGTLTYLPNTGFFGTDTFQYTITDTVGNVSAATTVTVTVDERIPPTTTADTASGLEDDNINIDVLSNDSAVQGQLDPSTLTIVSDPASGELTINGDGTLTYDPDPGFFGTDTFQYKISDTVGNISAATTVTVTIDERIPPTTAADLVGGVAGDDIVIDVLGNDTAHNGTFDLSTLTIVSGPAKGQAIPQANGTIVYRTTSGLFGTDTFQYTISDTAGNVSPATTVTVKTVESGLQNPLKFGDVNGSGTTTVLDALLIINHIGRSGLTSIPVLPEDRGPFFYDVNGSFTITTLDALNVINEVARQLALGESIAQPVIITDMASTINKDTETPAEDAGQVDVSLDIAIDEHGPVASGAVDSVDAVDSRLVDLLAEDREPDDRNAVDSALRELDLLDLE